VRAQPPHTIALVTESLADEYEVALLRGVLAVARRENVQVLCVAAGAVGDPDPERSAGNFAFDLIGADNVSGIVSVSSVLGGSVGADGLRSWVERYGDLPLCSVGVPFEGRPCIQVDNAAGAREVVRHLIEEHEARRIAYLRGPHGSVEAATRLQAYESALADAGINVDPRYVVDGDFTVPSGVQAIRTLLDDRGVRLALLDAVVAANDRMALGALEEMSRRGIEVPDQVAVVGFDDIESAQLAQPPLTTVVQPIEELGRRSLEMVIGMIRGVPVSSGTLPTQVTLRRSCGCTAQSISAAMTERPRSAVGVSFSQSRPVAIAELARAARGHFGAAGRGWEERLFDALVADVRDKRQALFNRALEALMRKVERSATHANIVQDVLSALRRQLLPCVDSAMRDRLEEVLGAARVFAGALSAQLETNRRQRAANQVREFRMSLLAALFEGRDSLSRAAAETLPALGVNAAVVTSLAAPGDIASDASVLFDFGSTGAPAPVEP
jgi:sigma-B regulation protein RsbU (phosphoserine phosphatase)